MGAEFAKFALIGGVVLVALLVFATVVKLIEVHRAAAWLTTRGRIVVSRVESRSFKGTSDTPRTGNFARIEFEYRVGGKNWRGNRISIGEQAPDFQVSETLARYPVGAEVDVFYDAQKPERAVLERELPQDFAKGLGLAFLYFGGGAAAAFLYFTRGVDWLSSRLPADSNATFAAIFGALGIMAAAIAWVKQRQATAATDWHPVTGEIVSTTTESYVGDSAEWMVMRIFHVPRVTYRYCVDEREFQSDRLDFGAIVSFTSKAKACVRLAPYLPGQAVRVLVNPDNPAEATLDARASNLWVLWIVAAILLALAWLSAQPTALR